MTLLSCEEVKNIQLEILRYVVQKCDQNGINYFLDSGTLIGAVRHQGYIPWDDDIDIGMLREDYNKFVRLMTHTNDKRFKFKCYELDRDHLYSFGKMVDTTTVLYEPDENGVKTSVNIDVFPYDNAPDDDNILKRMVAKRNRFRLLNLLRNGLILPSSLLKKIVLTIGKLILSVFPKDYFIKKMLVNEIKYAKETTERIVNLYGVSNAIADKSLFKSFTLLRFENAEYKVPIGYDQWLKINYGNYMELPPEEKRVTHHSYKAYKK